MTDTQPLPSWNDGAAKSAILDFIARVTNQGETDFVPPGERIATFDNDGTLWCEQPLQAQFFFMFDRVMELSAKDSAMVKRQPFKAVFEHDYNTLFGLGKQALFELAFATHAGMTDEDFDGVARGWLATAKHPQFGRLFKECVYRPQVELLAYLRGNGLVGGGLGAMLREFVMLMVPNPLDGFPLDIRSAVVNFVILVRGRSAGRRPRGRRCPLAGLRRVTRATKSRMADLAAPSFHEGSGCVSAIVTSTPNKG